MPSCPLHLAALASSPRHVQFASRAEPDLARLMDQIREHGRFSSNVKPRVLERLLDGEPWRHAFELAQAEAERTGVPVDDVLRGRVKYFERRVVFEHRAGDGVRFYYGALNVGGMGAPRYGRYCVVLGPCGCSDDDRAWVNADSLKGAWFTEGSDELDWDRLIQHVADNEHVHVLAGAKCFVPGESLADGLRRVCTNDDYLEGLQTRRPTLDEAAEIRSETDDEVHQRALRASLDGASRDEELDLGLHARLRELADKRPLRWVSVRA